MIVNIDRSHVDSEVLGNPSGGPSLPQRKIEGLKLLRGDAAREAIQCGGEQVFLPLLFPLAFTRWSGRRLHVIAIQGDEQIAGRINATALTKTVGDSPAGVVQQPTAKRAAM